MRKLMATTTAVALMTLSATVAAPPPARAQMQVYDPAAVTQMISQVSNSLRQIQQLEAQLTNQAAMLQKLGADVTQPLAAINQRASQILQQAQGIGYQSQSIGQQFQQLYPSSLSGQSLSQILQRYASWQTTSRNTLQDSMTLQNELVQSQGTTASAVENAVAASQGAAGQTAAIQATNQLLAALSTQLQGLQAILIAQARTQETILAQQQAATAAAQAESARHNAYTPTRGTFTNVTSF